MSNEVFDPLSGLSDRPAVRLLLDTAAKTNRERNEVDGHDRAPLDMQLRTAIQAMAAGMVHKDAMRPSDWACIAEACCIVQHVESVLRAHCPQPKEAQI